MGPMRDAKRFVVILEKMRDPPIGVFANSYDLVPQWGCLPSACHQKEKQREPTIP